MPSGAKLTKKATGAGSASTRGCAVAAATRMACTCATLLYRRSSAELYAEQLSQQEWAQAHFLNSVVNAAHRAEPKTNDDLRCMAIGATMRGGAGAPNRNWPVLIGLCLAVLAAHLPWGLQRLLGRVIGWLALHLARSRRHVAEVNLALCFPELDANARKTLLERNFAALGILYGSNLVGACVAAGQYTSAEVMGLYIVPEFQRKGLGTRLLQQTKQALASTGVTDLTMRVMSDSEPQVRLVQRFRAELVEHTSVFPSMQI